MRIRHGWLTIAFLLLVVGCGSGSSDVAAVDEAMERPTYAATCGALEPILGTSTSSAAQLRGALAIGPAELDEPMGRMIDLAEQVEADPTLVDDPAKFYATFGDHLEQILVDTKAITDWHRRNCGPETASSAWCEAFADATFERERAGFELMLSGAPSGLAGMLTSMDQVSLGLYQAILGAAPPDLAPEVQLLIDQYSGEGGPPQDEPASAARHAAQDAIIESLRDQCGLRVERSDL